MATKVFTYDDPQKFFVNSEINLNQTVHVTATANMTDAMRVKYHENQTQSVVLSMNEFIQIIFRKWFDEETILEQYLDLMYFLDNTKSVEPRIIESYKRNKNELLETLRLLYFIGIESSQLGDVLDSGSFSEKESLLTDLFSFFHENQSKKSYLNHHARNKSDLIKEIEEVTEFDFYTEPSIIFHGFYFITPEQQKVMAFIRSLGFKIIFVNYYNKNYPQTFSFMGRFLNEDYGWPSQEHWLPLGGLSSNHLGDSFSSIFEGEPVHYLKDLEIKKYEFNNFIDFLSHIEKNEYVGTDSENKLIMATNAQYMNSRMQEFYPENYKTVRNFLKYPIGYLLVKLHEMWNPKTGKIELDSDGFYKILSTQYFFSSEEDNLLEVYKDLSHFFTSVTRKEEWLEQFDRLLIIRQFIEKHYRHVDCEIDKYSIDFELPFNESPFSYLPYLGVSTKNIKKIQGKLLEVFDLAEDLFAEEQDDVNLKEHFEKMLIIIDHSIEQDRVGGFDKDLLLELKKKLSVSTNIDAVNKNYLQEAMEFYLAGSANNDDNHLIEPLINIDGELFRNRPLHITGLDEKGLPYGKYELPWPLTEELVEKLAIQNKEIELLLHRNNSVKEITRYLLHIMFSQSSKIELSHLKNYQDKSELEKSFYLDLMDEQIYLETQTADEKHLKSEPTIKEFKEYDISHYHQDQKAKFHYYPNRLLYAKSSKQLSYDSKFQQKFILSKLATYVLAHNQNEEEAVIDLLLDLFPQFNRFQIELAIEESKKYTSWVANKLGNPKEVSEYRKVFIYPNLKWSKDELNIESLYKQAEKIGVISDADFYNAKELPDNFIYPYIDIEYPGTVGEDDDD